MNNKKYVAIACLLVATSVLSGCLATSPVVSTPSNEQHQQTMDAMQAITERLDALVADNEARAAAFRLGSVAGCAQGDVLSLQEDGSWACKPLPPDQDSFRFESGHECFVGDVAYITINGTWQCGSPPGRGQFCTDQNHCIGPEGPRGPQGYQGPQGPVGPRGVQGPSVVPQTKTLNVTSAADPAIGTIVTATATCVSGQKALGGGGRVMVLEGNVTGNVTANETLTDSNGDTITHTVVLVNMLESYPSAAAVWTVRGIVNAALPVGAKMNVYAYAVCTTA